MEVFTIYSDEIKDRLDPFSFSSSHISLVVQNFKCKPLSELVDKIMSGPFGSSLKSEAYLKYGIPFIRVRNIKKGDIDRENLVYINEEDNARLKNSQLFPNDIVFSKIGTIGEVALIPADFEVCNISENNIGVRLKKGKDVENNRYIFYTLQSDFIQRQIIQNLSGNVQKFLNVQTVKDIQIPYPPSNIQKIIVEIMDKAYALKRENLAIIDSLLQSIDGYLLSELGITIPEVNEVKIFSLYSDELQGERIDPFYYQPKYLKKYNSLKESKYQVEKLGDIITDLKNGVEIRTYSESGYRYLRVTDLTDNEISNSSPRFVTIDKIPEKIKLNSNDFLISRSGSLGLVSIVTDELLDCILSSHIFKVSLDTKKILPSFLQVYLRSSVGQFQFFQKNNGGIVPEINQDALKSILIVLPPLVIQNSIANEIQNRLNQVESLKVNMQDIVVKAKSEVDKILLGK